MEMEQLIYIIAKRSNHTRLLTHIICLCLN